MEENKKKDNQIINADMVSTLMDNIQKYILGTKKNGDPRAMYDIVKDYTMPKKKKKHKKKHKYDEDKPLSTYDLYLSSKKKKKKHKKKHWHI